MTAPPIPGSMPITFAEQAMVLLPDRALYWPGVCSLVIADLHLGKAASFRTHGIPVPAGGTGRDLLRLTNLLLSTQADRLIILGDFLHARAGRQPEVLDEMSRWRAEHPHLDILLVRGNHDRAAGRVLPEWNMREVDEPFVETGVALLHDPATPTPLAGLAGLAGHIHPATPVRDFDGSTINIASFIQEPDRLILPSFGSFTGGHPMRPKVGRRNFLVMSGRIVRMEV